MWRYINFVFLCFTCLFFCSCVSSDNLYILPSSEGGQLLFFRPSEFKIKDFIVQKLSFDMTIHVRENVVYNDSIFNYSLEFDKIKITFIKNINIKLILDNKIIPLTHSKLLYKKTVGEKIIARYSAFLSRQDTNYILNSKNGLQIELDYSGRIVKLDILNDFNRQLDEARLILL